MNRFSTKDKISKNSTKDKIQKIFQKQKRIIKKRPEVAQSVERRPYKPCVASSILAFRITKKELTTKKGD